MFHVQQAIFSPLKRIRLHEEITDGLLENLSFGGGGGVGGEVQKRYSRKGKLNGKKIHARQLILKNIHSLA